jgi:hypothetical protein
VAPDPGAQEALQFMTRAFAPGLADTPILASQACFRPVTPNGLPLLGPVPGIAKAFVAAGPSVWGILKGPDSGEARAKLIVAGAPTQVDLHRFDPALAHGMSTAPRLRLPPSSSLPDAELLLASARRDGITPARGAPSRSWAWPSRWGQMRSAS